MGLDKATKKVILDKYFSLEFPASYSSLFKFRKSLKQNLGIDVTVKELRTLMKNNLFYQTNVKKPKSFLKRKNYSAGVGS